MGKVGAPFGNRNAIGNRGRRSFVEEWVRAQVINKSWDRLLKKFEKKNKTDDDEKLLDQIAIEIAKKTIPQNIDLTTKGESINYTDSQINAIIQRYLLNCRTKS